MEYRYNPKTGLFLEDLEKMSPAQMRELSQIVDFWMNKRVSLEDGFMPHFIPRDNSRRALQHIITLSPKFSQDPIEHMQRVLNESYHEQMTPQIPIFDYISGVIPLVNERYAVLEIVRPSRLTNKPSNLSPLLYRKIGVSEY